MKIAILQKKSLDRQLSRNSETVIETMKEAAKNGADILLLPEAFLTGYSLPMDNKEALSGRNLYLQKISDAAKELHLGVVVTAITKGWNKPRNSAYVVKTVPCL